MTTKNIALIAGPLCALATAVLLLLSGWSFAASYTAAVTCLCAIWWVFEPIPIPATSLLPLALFPLVGVLSSAQVAQAYGSPLILLMLGGFILSSAMERSGAHRRLALGMVNIFGGASHKRIVIGFMLASALLSMWISNTATTLMLLPVALAVLQSSEDNSLTVPLLLGICYAASLGGIGTPIGTPPNLVFMRVYTENTGIELSFLQWMAWAVPVVVLFLPLMAWWLTRNLIASEAITIPSTGAWTQEEVRVLSLFALTALAWITRTAPMGGWSTWLPHAGDASVALLAAVAMFVIPNGRGGRLLDWETANRIPWGMLLLFGGGIAIAKAFVSSGLAANLAESLSSLSSLPVLLLIAIICLSVTFLTEITSNTATTSLLMPVLAAAAVASELDPALLMVPAAMSASCAFMLPVATAPNAITFGSGKIPIKTMMREGLVLNLMGAGVISLVCYWLVY